MSGSPRLTNVPNFKNSPRLGLAEGNGSFSNRVLATLVLGLPWLLKRLLPIVSHGGFKTYIFLVTILGVPITVAYWTLMSMFGPRKNEKVALPGKDIEEYITIHDLELKARYHNKEKIPMQTFHDAYFDGKIDFNGSAFPYLALYLFNATCRVITGDILETMEARHDWAKMTFTPELFKFVFTQMIPEIIVHSQSQDEEQVRDHYDRKSLRLLLCTSRLSMFQVAMTFMDGWCYPSDTSTVFLNVYSYQVLGSTHGLHVWYCHFAYRTANSGTASGQ